LKNPGFYHIFISILPLQERLAALREKVRLEDMHDSTLRIDDEKVTKSAEELEAHRRLQLENFVEGLENLKKATGGAGLPGFGSSFLKDPRFAGVFQHSLSHADPHLGLFSVLFVHRVSFTSAHTPLEAVQCDSAAGTW
jgi:hypothetical protein